MTTETKELTVTTFSGETLTFDSPEELIDAAREAFRRSGGMIDSDTRSLIGAAWPYLSESDPDGYLDTRLYKAAQNFHVPPREREPSPFDEEIRETAEALEEAQEALEEADRELHEACRDLVTVGGGEGGWVQLQHGKLRLRVADESGRKMQAEPSRIRELDRRCEDLATEYLRRREEHQAAMVAHNQAKLKRSRWWATQAA